MLLPKKEKVKYEKEAEFADKQKKGDVAWFYIKHKTQAKDRGRMNHNNKSINELVSVIIPVYNERQYLQKCIFSICNQTIKNLEIIFSR